MRGRKTNSFRLPKARFRGLRIAFMAAYLFTLGFYLYHGFQPYQVGASAPERLFIPSIGLSTPVDDIAKIGPALEVPEVIAGAYSENTHKTLLVGHSNTVFTRLKELQTGASLTFDRQNYLVTSVTVKAKSEIDMSEILAPTPEPTLILMTCTGQHLSGHDYSHRLIITAQKV